MPTPLMLSCAPSPPPTPFSLPPPFCLCQFPDGSVVVRGFLESDLLVAVVSLAVQSFPNAGTSLRFYSDGTPRIKLHSPGVRDLSNHLATLRDCGLGKRAVVQVRCQGCG